MKKLIDKKWSKEELDSFLTREYGFGIWEFECIFSIVYGLYDEKADKKIFEHLERRTDQLKELKMKTIELIDDFLIGANFYNLNKQINLTETKKWTPQARYRFIIRHYNLSPFFTVINEQSAYLKEQIDRFFNQDSKLLRFPVFLKPFNFLVLIFSYAIKRGSQVDWINMEKLFNWFSKKLIEIDLIDYFGYKDGFSPSPEILRFTRNKYRKKNYNILAKKYFVLFFKIKKAEGKKKFPNPLDELGEFLEWNITGLENKKEWIDLYMLLPMVYHPGIRISEPPDY